MKKIISFALAITLIATMSVTAFADNSETNDGKKDTSINVSGKYVPANSDPTISVIVEWDAMNFTYEAGNSGRWNTTEHKYENAVAAGWKEESKTITVTNHSDTAVTAAFSFAGNNGIKGEFTEDSLELVSANTSPYAGTTNAPSGTTSFSIAKDSPAISAETDLGTITVKITSNSVTDGDNNTPSDGDNNTPSDGTIFFDADSLKNAGTNSDGIGAALTEALNTAIQDNKETFTIQMSATYSEDDIYCIFNALNGVGSELTNLKLIFKGLTTMPNGLVNDPFDSSGGTSLTELSYLSLPDVTKIEDYALRDLNLDTLELTAEGTIILGNNSFGDDKNLDYTLVLNKDKTSEVNGKTWNGYTFYSIEYAD